MKKIIIFAITVVLLMSCALDETASIPNPTVVVTGVTNDGKTTVSVSSGSGRSITETFMPDLPFLKGAMFVYIRNYPNIPSGWSADLDLIPLVSQGSTSDIVFDTIDGNQYQISITFALQDPEGNFGCYTTETEFFAVEDNKISIEMFYYERGSDYWDVPTQTYQESESEFAPMKGMSVTTFVPGVSNYTGFMPFIYYNPEKPTASAFDYVNSFIKYQNKAEYAFFDINDAYDDDYVLK